jgi:riboflavin kinase/FMN adenylyltransferase
LGPRPTDDRPPPLEVHLHDFDGELYGRRLGLTLLAHLRPTRKFDGIEALKLQIQRDADEARRLASLQPPEVPL